MADHQLTVPTSIIDVIDPPTYETLEAMIRAARGGVCRSGQPDARILRPTSRARPRDRDPSQGAHR
ncbi:MAG: hypothetical protein WKF78_11975 [Candidatus Limnocylindrales bacterium]